MTTEFNETIKRWIHLDDEIRRLTEEKKEVTDELNQYIDSNNMERKRININLSTGSIKFVTTKTPQTLSLKYLETCLNNIIEDEDQVKQILDYIKDNREITETTSIRRFYK